MAERLAIPSKELQLQIVGAKQVFAVPRAQRINLTSDIPSTITDEIGNPEHAGEAKDIPNVTLTFSCFDTGIRTYSVLTGVDYDSYPSAGVDISNLGEIDAIIYVKDPDVADYVKSASVRRLQIRDFTFSYSVDGESTEDYTAIGSEYRWFRNDVVVDKFTSGSTVFTLTQTPIQLRNGRYAVSVILDGKYLEETSGMPSTGQYRIVGTTLTTGDSRTSQVLVVYHASPTGNNWSDVSDNTMPAAIRGRDVSVEILANSINRVQSVTINGSLNVQEVREMGNKSVVGYQRQVPTIDGSITVLDTDLDLIDLFTYGTVSSGDVEFQPGVGCADNTIDLEIILHDPCDDSSPYTVLKTVYLPSITPVGDAYSVNVNGNAGHTFNFRSLDARCYVYSGERS